MIGVLKQNTADILDYMESGKDKAKDVLDAYIEALKKPEKIEAAKLSEIDRENRPRTFGECRGAVFLSGLEV